ncbi:MAG TPA: hypothetical protein PKW33_17100 [Anaerolineaceae bacterium]|nr:hypothetical protein [Anaerolineaceae bacterium]HPN53317.1 hypothetical protein [Anaerolineaceae bacterium]
MEKNTLQRDDTFVQSGRQGRTDDVIFLMNALEMQDDLATSRWVDFALSLVRGQEGVGQTLHFLFHGSLRQRNVAALYFKRRGWFDELEEALQQGLVDAVQGYAQ